MSKNQKSISVVNISSFSFRVLVGAPEAQSRFQEISRGGAVFKCRTDQDYSCEEVPFDKRGNFSKFIDH